MTRPPLSEEEIFQVARRIEDRDARAAYLEQVCAGDAALRQQVEALLAAHDDSPSFLEAPHSAIAVIPPTLDQPITEKPGTQIGPYKLLQQIGEGGFGVVYMAEQTGPVRRKVALKIIKPGMDTKEVIARFDAERQALALMDHPNIARVLDAGATESGRPYFVMELVKGMPLTKYCDKNHLLGRERLKLFVEVCHATQHAHQKGIIHRDLKPSNIMVTLHDGKPVPKVIDFGVAKALSQQLTEKTLFTAYGQMVGTPAYMSPEQAEMSGLDIDTRSDVYSLGVLLYELLTGSTPFDSKRLREAGYAEMQRIIREEEPPKPSTRLTTLGEESANVSQNRGTDPKKLGQLVRGDLDWIVMKALDKERNRRYETANGFAADIERFLTDEPVEACPPSAMYRFRKFARRNKAPLAVGMVAALALVVVAVGATIAAGQFRWLAQRNADLVVEKDGALNKAIEAEATARDAQQEAEEALTDAQRQRQRAEANFALARSAVDEFLNEVTENELLTVPGLQLLRQELLASAMEFYEDFAKDEANASELQVELAAAHYRISLIRGELGQSDEARVSNSLSMQLFEQLRDEGNNSIEVWVGLAKTYFRAERYDETITLCREVLESDPLHAEVRSLLADTYNRLAIADKNDNDIAAALAYHRQALPLREGLAQEFPDNSAYLDRLGGTINNIGVLLGRQRRHREALAMYERSASYSAEAYTKSPQSMLLGRSLCISLGNVASYQKFLGEQEAALQSFQRLVTIRRKLAFENPAVPSLKGDLYKAWIDLGGYQQELGHAEQASRSFNAAREVLENIPRETPEELFELAVVYAALATPAEGLADVPHENQADDHQRYADLGVETLRQAVDAGYRDLEAIRSNPQLEALRERGDLPELALLEVRLETELLQADETETDQPRTADRNRAAKLLRELAASNALDGRNQQTRAATLHAMGVIQTGLKQYEPAEQSLNEALRLRQELLAEGGDNLQRRLDLLATRSAQGSLLWKTRREPEAHRLWQECLAEFQRLAEEVPQDEQGLLKRILHEEHLIGDAYANIGLFDVTTDYVRRHLERGRADSEQHAISLALAGEFDAHRRYTRIFAPQRKMNPEEVLWVVSMSPDAGLSPEELQRLAEEVVGKEAVRRFWRHFVAATGEFRAGRYQQALDRLEESAIGDAAKYRDYWRALILEKLGRHEEAVTWLGKAETLYREFVLHKSSSGVARGIGWFIAYSQVMRREAWNEVMGHAPPDDPWQHVLQANGYRLIGEDEQADQEVGAALIAAPDAEAVVAVLDSLGVMETGDHQLAGEDFVSLISEAIGKFPDVPALYRERAAAYARLERWDEAVADAIVALDASSSENVEFWHGPAYQSLFDRTGNRDELFARLADARPDDVHLWVERAHYFARHRDWSPAARHYAHVIETSETDVRIGRGLYLREYAYLLLLSAQNDAFQELCGKLAADVDESDVDHAINVGRICCISPDSGIPGEQVLALLEPLRNVVRGNSVGSGIVINLGLGQLRVGRYDEAITTLKSKRSSWRAFAFALALAHHYKGEDEDAATWYETATSRPRTSPLEADGHVGNWLLLHALRREALHAFEPAKYHEELAAEYARQERWEEAADDFAKVLELSPDERPHPGPERPEYQRLMACGDDVFERVAEIRPDDRDLWIERGRHFAWRNLWNRALEQYARVISVDAPRPEDRHWNREYASLLLLTGQTKQYHTLCKRLVEHVDSDDERVAFHAAMTCALMPNPDVDPVRLVEPVDRASPPDHPPHGMVHLRARDFEVTISDAEQTGPFAVFHNFLVALAHARAGNPTAAQPAYEIAMAEFQQVTDPDKPDSGLRRRFVHWWLWLHVLQREALREFDPDQWQQLYGVNEQSAKVENN